MDWKRALEQERAALMRLVSLLHALAGLAELAAGRSAIVRSVVLWLLRGAGAAVHEFVADEFGTAPFDADPFAPSIPNQFVTGQTASAPLAIAPADDALCLAASLRALANLLEAQAALLFSCPDQPPGRFASDNSLGLHARAMHRALRTPSAFPALPAPDTS